MLSILPYCVLFCSLTTLGGTASVIAAGQNPQSQQASDDRKGAGDWLKLAPQGAPFSVSLPGAPSEKTKNDDSGMKVHTYKVKAGATDYQVVWFAGVSYAVLQRGPLNVLFPRGLQDILKSARQEGKKELLTTHEADVTLNGCQGRESTMESASGKLEAKAFVAGYDFITVAVFHPKDDSGSADARRFLGSLTVADPRLGTLPIAVAGGSGVSSPPDTRPLPLNRPRPNYTRQARDNKVQGVIRVKALVGADGMVKDVRLVSHLPDGLDGEAIAAVQHMRFKPATKGGQPVATWVSLDVDFNLR